MDSKDSLIGLTSIFGFIFFSWEFVWKRFFGINSNIFHLRRFGSVDRFTNPFLYWLLCLVCLFGWILSGVTLYIVLKIYLKL